MMADRLTPRERLSHKLRDGKYRARKLGCVAELVTVAAAVAAGMLAETKCYYCQALLGEEWALEHKTPLARGGAHRLDNLAKSCPPCNEVKHISEALDYLATLDLAS